MSRNRDGKLLAETRRLLKEHKRTYQQIYDHTSLQPGWLSGVCTGAIKEPSVNKVERLYEYLSAKPLQL